ncbi:MAG: nucleotidyltransferase domain-containing protein [Planctomycetaceae bacterium]|jgi:predicted nucleotidyltransferase|nr:nucleotidyltransferase domain-containing protein [Planctomycetaceae bacterium]
MVDDFRPLEGLVQQYIADVKAVYPVDKIYLYGSYAHGTPHQDSDVDLCFFSPAFENISHLDALIALHQLKCKYDKDIYIEPNGFATSDLTTGNPFVEEVLRTGIEL